MFEVGFSELVMVTLVALLVIGPEKLPKVARMAGFWLGKAKRTVEAVKQEINEEFQAEELRQALKKQYGADELKQLLDETGKNLNTINDSLKQPVNTSADPGIHRHESK